MFVSLTWPPLLSPTLLLSFSYSWADTWNDEAVGRRLLREGSWKHAGFSILFSAPSLVAQPLLAKTILTVRSLIPFEDVLGFLPMGPAEWDKTELPNPSNEIVKSLWMRLLSFLYMRQVFVFIRDWRFQNNKFTWVLRIWKSIKWYR